MNDVLNKILNADSIQGETAQERDKRLSTDLQDDSEIRLRLASIYKDNEKFKGVTFQNVEKLLSEALNPNHSASNNIDGIKDNMGTKVVSKEEKLEEKEKIKMADQRTAEQEMKDKLANQGNVPGGNANQTNNGTQGEVTFNEKTKKFLEDYGVSEKDVLNWAANANTVNGLKSYIGTAVVSDLLTVKGAIGPRIKDGANKTGRSNVLMHYQIGEPVEGVLASLRIPGKDYSNLTKVITKGKNAGQTREFLSDGMTPREPRKQLMYRLEKCFGYNPSTGECDKNKVDGDIELVNKWVDYLYKLAADTATIKESIFDETAIDKLHVPSNVAEKYKQMGAMEALNEIKANQTRRPFGDDLFVAEPPVSKPSVCGYKINVNGKQEKPDALGTSDFWPKKAGDSFLYNMGITVASVGNASNPAGTLNISEGKNKDGAPVIRGSFTYKAGVPSMSQTAHPVTNGKMAWVKTKIKLPIVLKYIDKNKDNKEVVKVFNIYGYVPVYGQWERDTKYPEYVSIKTRTTTSTGTGRKSAAETLSRVMAGSASVDENIQALVSLSKTLGKENIKELITKGTISTKTSDVTGAAKEAQNKYMEDIRKAEAARKAAAEARKNKI